MKREPNHFYSQGRSGQPPADGFLAGQAEPGDLLDMGGIVAEALRTSAVRPARAGYGVLWRFPPMARTMRQADAAEISMCCRAGAKLSRRCCSARSADQSGSKRIGMKRSGGRNRPAMMRPIGAQVAGALQFEAL